MPFNGADPETSPLPPGTGQVVLEPVAPDLIARERAQALYRLSDPALSELGLEEFLSELLERVQEALSVDTVAILLLDNAAGELVARAAKGIEEEVERGVRIPIGRGFAGRIAAERVPIVIEDVDHADILNPILRQKGIQSLLGVPLIVEGDLIGVLHIGSLTTRKFDQADLGVLQVAAARAAPGIERARLYSQLAQEHRIAVALQRSLLPRRLSQPFGTETAARYAAASDVVGGDWYDVFELADGQIGITIGDVVGHGIPAAALMSQLRATLHAYAVDGSGPAETLAKVDRFIQSSPDEMMATAAYAVFDTASGEVRIASAGHLPPLIVSPDGSRFLELGAAPPLGAVPYGRYTETVAQLRTGESLMLYTDGLVERPGTPLSESLDRLAAAVSPARGVEEICELALDALVPEPRIRDDIAIIVVRNAGLPEVLELKLPADPTVLASVRRVLRRWLHQRAVPEQIAAEVTMAMNEACANAIEHAYAPRPATFRLRAEIVAGVVRITVADNGSWREPRGRDRGRGLQIIEAAMDEVHVRSEGGGTVIEMSKAAHA